MLCGHSPKSSQSPLQERRLPVTKKLCELIPGALRWGRAWRPCLVLLCCLCLANTTAVRADIEDIEDIADMLEVMVDDLGTQGDGCGGALYGGEPTVIEDASGVLFASSSFLVSEGGTTELIGSVFLIVDPDAGTVEAVMAITRDSVVYTLDFDVDVSDNELHICGSISYSSQTYTGGWTYSVANGLETEPGTQSGFEDALIEIFGCDPENPLAWNLADALQFAANILIMGIN